MLYFKSQKGVGLIALIIAAALVCALGLTVSLFLNTQNKISTKVSASGDCQNIAKNFREYFLSDNALWVNSLPPNTAAVDPALKRKFIPLATVNVDGLNRFANVNENIISPPQMLSLGTSLTSVPSGTKTINYLNYNHSYTRLVTMANQLNLCYGENDEINSPVIFSNLNGVKVARLEGITLGEDNAEVRMRIDFGTANLCSSSHGLTALPTSNQKANFKIMVRSKIGTTSEQSCSISGSTALEVDKAAPLVLTRISNLDIDCPTTSGSTHCFHGLRGQLSALPHPPGKEIRIEARTVRATSECLNCMQSLNPIQCDTPSGPMLVNNAMATGANGCADKCADADPGSIFFCKLGTKQNFATAPWWPCHDQPLTVPGRVRITYGVMSAGETQTKTEATIAIEDLPSKRNYFFDVRALDSYGQTFSHSLQFTMPALYQNLSDALPPECACDNSCAWTSPSCTVSAPPTCVFNCCSTQLDPMAANSCSFPNQEARTQTCTQNCTDPNTSPVTVIDPAYCLPPGQPVTVNPTVINCSPNPLNTVAVCGLPPVGVCTPPPGETGWSACVGGVQERTGTCSLSPITSCADSCRYTRACGAGSPSCNFPNHPEAGWGWCNGATCTTAGQQERFGVCENPNGTPSTVCGTCLESRDCYATGCAATCDFSSANFGTCTGACGTSGQQNRTGICRDSNGNPTTGCPDNCVQTQICGVTCTSSCNYASASWGNCTPSCPQTSGLRTRIGGCFYSDNTPSTECGGCIESEPCTSECTQATCEWGAWSSCTAQNCATSTPSQKTRTQSCLINGLPSRACAGECSATETVACEALNCPNCRGLSERVDSSSVGGVQNPFTLTCYCETPLSTGQACVLSNGCAGTIVNSGYGSCGQSSDCHDCTCWMETYCNTPY